MFHWDFFHTIFSIYQTNELKQTFSKTVFNAYFYGHIVKKESKFTHSTFFYSIYEAAKVGCGELGSD